ncbi:hypothetical protein FF1_006804 [Malus domestica]
MGPRRSTRLNVTISVATPPPRVSITGTIAVARSMVSSPQLESCHPRRLTTLRSRPKLHFRMHHASSSPLSWPSLLLQPSLLPPSSLSRPDTISTNHRAGGIFTIFLHRFDISQLKSYA